MEKVLNRLSNEAMNQLVNDIKQVIGILIGSFIFAFSINAIYRPFGFLSTGFNGISMIFNYLLGWPLAICSYAFNIVFVIFGFKLVNKKFAILSIIGITSTSIFIGLTQNFRVEIDEPIVAVVFGGLVLGLGVGIALKSGGAIGGMNILCKIVNKYFSISIGTFDMSFNIVLIFLAALLFDINIAMYTIMARFVATKTIDAIIEGFNKRKTVIIVSSYAQNISNQIINKLGRGATLIKSTGAYTGNDHNMIYCVVRLTQLSKLKEIAKKEDKKAFITILDAREVVGRGFR